MESKLQWTGTNGVTYRAPLEWVKPGLWKRLAYLFNPPPQLIINLDDARWHKVSE